MNSFSTSADSLAGLTADGHGDLASEKGIEFIQNKSPKIDKQTMKPASYPQDPAKEFCPPGHGDLYPSLLGTGLLASLMTDGIEYVFVSNSDNLGGTLDVDLLAYFAASGKDFLMEAANRTEAHKKGGHLATRAADGRLLLRESAMRRDEDKADFQDVSKHRFFNTNNLWLKLSSVDAAMRENGGVMPLPLIKNSKTVNPRDASSTPVFQLETAMGAAIEAFENSGAVVVPRSRFAPVKVRIELTR